MKQMKEERHGFGSFYYRFAHGESASDVFDRVSTFLDSLYRSFESGRCVVRPTVSTTPCPSKFDNNFVFATLNKCVPTHFFAS